MGFLQRLMHLGNESCESCGNRPATAYVRLPNGTRFHVCAACREVTDKLYEHPVRSVEVGAILDNIIVGAKGIWQIPWGATREKILNLVNPSTAELLRQSVAPTMMAYHANIANRPVEVAYLLPDGHLCELCIAIMEPTVAISDPLRQRYGEPSVEYSAPGLQGQTETTMVWEMFGYQVEAIRTDNGSTTISFKEKIETEDVRLMLDCTPAGDEGILDLPWGANHLQVCAHVLRKVMDEQADDSVPEVQGPELFGYDIRIGNHIVHFTFRLKNGGLDEVTIQPRGRVVVDLMPFFAEEFGETTPQGSMPESQPGELAAIWNFVQFEVQLVRKLAGSVEITFRGPRG